MSPSGEIGMSLGYNAYFEGSAFFKDAIRILWRIAIDAIWFDEERAKAFLSNSMKFINSKGGASAAEFYQLNSELLAEEDVWEDMIEGKIVRHHREHSPLTIGMWSTAAMAVGSDEDKKNFSLEMAKFYDKDADYFGLAKDTSGLDEDTHHNEMYFEQFLGWFSTSLMTGVFSNIVDDIDNPKENKAGLETKLSKPEESAIALRGITHSKFSISRSKDVFTFASSDKNARWAIFGINGQQVAQLHGAEARWNAQKKIRNVHRKNDGFFQQ